MAGPSWASSGTYLSQSTSTPAFAVPAGVVAGDIIVVCFFTDTNSTTVTAMPTGFAHADGSPVTAVSPFNHSLVVAVKRATGADTGTYNFTLSGTVFTDGQAHRYINGTTSGAILDTPSGAATDATNGTVTPAVSMATTGADRLILHAGTCWSGGTWTAPTGYTKRQQGGVGLSTLADVAQAVQGGTGSITATVSNADKRAAWIGALASPAATPTVTPTGLAVATALGTPTAVNAMNTVSPSGLAVAKALGTPTVAQSLAIANSGIAIPVALGMPTVSMIAGTVAPAGLAIPIVLGTPAVSGQPYVQQLTGGSWWELESVLAGGRAVERWWQTVQPLACPNDGEPLRRSVDGILYCPYDNWRPDDQISNRRRPANLGRDWGGLRGIRQAAAQDAAVNQLLLSCPNDGEPLSIGADGTRFCRYDGWMPPPN